MLSYYYEIVITPNPVSPKTVHLDLPTFFSAFYLDSKKSPSSCLFITRQTKDDRRSLGHLATLAWPLRGLKPCSPFACLAILP